MKLIGRIFYGLLVALLGFNIYGLSLYQMEVEAVTKYGNKAVLEEDNTFFKNMFDFYTEDYVLEHKEVKSETNPVGYSVYVFQGIANETDYVRFQIQAMEGFKYDKGLELSLVVEGQTDPIKYKLIEYDTFAYVNLQLNSIVSTEEKAFKDLIDFQVIASYSEKVDNKTETKSAVIYDFDGVLLLDKENMNLSTELVTPVDPDAETPVYPTPESLGLVEAVRINHFKEFSKILWRNMLFFLFAVVFVTYLVFFRKKKPYVRRPQKPEVIINNNINARTITSVSETDEIDEIDENAK